MHNNLLKSFLKWERGNFAVGQCDIPECKQRVRHRLFNYTRTILLDAEIKISLCEFHSEYKRFKNLEDIIKAYKKK